MIISASRRTDVPAFYSEWLVNRLRAGWCEVPNPFNRSQVSRVSLRPEDVDVIVFWTRYARPLVPHLDEIDARGYRSYFLYTLVDYPRPIETATPAPAAAVAAFRELSGRVGPGRVVWRYDPILLGEPAGAAFHRERFERLAGLLEGATWRVVVSVVDIYRKMRRRLRDLEAGGVRITDETGVEPAELAELLASIAATAAAHGMTATSCSEAIDMGRYGIQPGKCIDDRLIRELFGISVSGTKDPSQRAACGCVTSRDIGMYDTCVFGCQYCYATSSLERARENRRRHDPLSPSIVP
jgi:hypothetical protein